jgi:hypothetical protein
VTQAAPAAIERIDVFGYELTYAHGDYVMSSGRVVNRLASTVVRITTRDGWRALARSARSAARTSGLRRGRPGRHPRARAGAHRRDPTNLADVHRRLDGALRGHDTPRARSTSPAGMRSAGSSASPWRRCWRVLQRELPLYVAIPLGPPGDMAAFVTRERELGIRNFQAKLGADPEDDARRVAAILPPRDRVTRSSATRTAAGGGRTRSSPRGCSRGPSGSGSSIPAPRSRSALPSAG